MSDHDTRPNTPDPTTGSLSPAGRAREDDILRLLHTAADARRARRATLRRAVLTIVAIATGAAGVWLARPAQPVDRSLATHSSADRPYAAPAPSGPSHADQSPKVAESDHNPALPEVAVVTNAALVIGDCDSLPPAGRRAPDVCLLSDDQLLAALAETGESYGLVRRGDHVEVVRNGP